MAFEFSGAGKTLEGDEEFFRVRLVETGSVIPNETGRLPVDFRQAEFNDRLLLLAGVFPGVAEEVVQDHLEQVAHPR